jgi:hypothetical protein
MTSDAFEQLVSQWLDDPTRVDLRAQIDAATAENPAFGAIFEQWQRSEAAIRGAANVPAGVDWHRLHEHTITRVGAWADAADDARLERTVRDATRIDAAVDWPRLKAHIVARIATEERFALRHRRTRWLVRATATLGAAAALVLALLPAGDRAPTQTSVTIREPAKPDRSLAFSTIRPPHVSEPQQPGVVAVTIAAAERRRDPVPERFFVVDPPVRPAAAEDVPDYY